MSDQQKKQPHKTAEGSNATGPGTWQGAEKPARRTTGRDLSHQLFEIGKLPPQAVDLEEAVLGSLMIDRDALLTVADILRAPVFYKEAHAKIYAAISRLFQAGSPVDILTVTNELKRAGELESVGGAYYISSLTNRVASAANVEFHARIIQQMFIKREIIRNCSETIASAYDETTDCFDNLAQASRVLDIESAAARGQQEKHISVLARQSLDEYGKREQAQQVGKVMGVPFGFKKLDKLTNGGQPGDLIILAARPAMGKTSFMLNTARNAAGFGHAGAIFSLEMTAGQLVNRMLIAESQVAVDGFREGTLMKFQLEALAEGAHKLTELPIVIDDTPALTVTEFRARARRMKQRYGINWIIIDYLQLMKAGSEMRGIGSREQEISAVSQTLKAVAKELNIPVIALSQLSREVEKRPDKRPQLSDLRESGAIEQDADLVWFIYRPEYYGFAVDEKGDSTAGVAEIIIAKHRNGEVGSVMLKWVGSLTKFINPEDDLTTILPADPSIAYNPRTGLSPSQEFTGFHADTDIEEPF